jgi:enoyl-CoA hydratase/carnithine racemase
VSDLSVEKHGRVTLVTLNRPDKHNAMSHAMMADLAEAVRAFNADPEQYVGVITGAGDKAFSSGADLKDMASRLGSGERRPAEWPDLAGISDGEKPFIAAVNGLAVAGGLELAVSCDIRIASTNAWFSLSEVKIGMVAGIGAAILPRLMPMGAAMDMILTGDRVSAEDAYRLGLVQKLTEPGKLLEAAFEKAETIAANSQAAVWGAKKIIKFWRDAMLAEQHSLYQAMAHRVLLTGDNLEGARAFNEKRPPNFKNRWPSL